MENEIEIKLIVSKNIEESFNELYKNQGVKVVSQHHDLANIYFDTDDKLLRQWDMGLRIRVNGGHIEQTIKTAGQVIGGLHQRPEYNIDLDNTFPKLSLFPSLIWPNNCNLPELQKSIKPLFSTDFLRRSSMLIYPDGSIVDLVYDVGTITSDDKNVEICEVELELVKGKPQLLFNLAHKLAELNPLRFGTVSKAARGYQLANSSVNSVKSLTIAPVLANDTLEQAYIKTVSHGLEHWQYHVELFIESGDYLAIKELRQALQLIIKANELYQDYLVNSQLKSLTKELFWLMEQLAFIDQYTWVNQLLAGNGQKFKKLNNHKQIFTLLENQRYQFSDVNSLEQLFTSTRHSHLVSRLIQWVYFKPWRLDTAGETLEKFQRIKLRRVAGLFLAQDWEAVQQTLPYEATLTYQDYLAQRQNLQHNMQVGICVGNIYEVSARSNFRAPWQDISAGIEQLLQLEPIYQLLRDELITDEGNIKEWLSRKQQSLIGAMELSRKSALKLMPYWQ
ncbi:MAG: CYTH domain-containing protein [Gammaproteobacteria bacterium]|nr:CYTH domain-containing protein [Gammaproteobacteria bacterium]